MNLDIKKIENINWNYPTNIWFGLNRIQHIQKACNDIKINKPLFYRDKRKARLTETGQLLLNYCERILSLCEETCRALDELQTLASKKISFPVLG